MCGQQAYTAVLCCSVSTAKYQPSKIIPDSLTQSYISLLQINKIDSCNLPHIYATLQLSVLAQEMEIARGVSAHIRTSSLHILQDQKRSSSHHKRGCDISTETQQSNPTPPPPVPIHTQSQTERSEKERSMALNLII